MPELDKVFTGSIPAIYDEYLVPLIFEPYAADIASRLKSLTHGQLLEVAAGTGVVTRAMAKALPAAVDIVATDLNPDMIKIGQARGTSRPVTWKPADVNALPIADRSIDVVVCQFGVMFFPDKPHAFREMHRVLKPGGRLVFNVWDALPTNDFSHIVHETLAKVFPADPPKFLARTPYAYNRPLDITRDLVAGGFTSTPRFTTVRARSHSASAADAARGICQGTPIRAEIEARDASKLEAATDAAAAAIAARFGHGAIDGHIQAVVVDVTA